MVSPACLMARLVLDTVDTVVTGVGNSDPSLLAKPSVSSDLVTLLELVTMLVVYAPLTAVAGNLS